MMPTRSREAADISTFCLRRFSDTTLCGIGKIKFYEVL
jgi:hypothetical protein